MANLNKHRKAITEAGYTLSKDGTQVTNKEGKTVAGTNDKGFFSGSSALTKIFKGDTKAKGKAPAKSSKKASAETAPKTSKRPPSKKINIEDMAEKAIDATPKSSTGGPARYNSASAAGTPSLMSQYGRNAETADKGPERPGAFSVPKPKPREKSIWNRAGGKPPVETVDRKKPPYSEYAKMTSAERKAAGMKPMLSQRQYSGNVWL